MAGFLKFFYFLPTIRYVCVCFFEKNFKSYKVRRFTIGISNYAENGSDDIDWKRLILAIELL